MSLIANVKTDLIALLEADSGWQAIFKQQGWDVDTAELQAMNDTDFADILLIQRHILMVSPFSPAQIFRADVYPAGVGDGIIGLADLLLAEIVLQQ